MAAPYRAEYPLAPLGEVRGNVQLHPAWDRARELLAAGRQAARELAAEIENLRELYLRQGQGRRTDREPFAQGVQKVQQGFVAELRDQLGLHHEVAKRLLLDAQRERQIRAIASGELEVVEEGGQARPVTEEVREAAQQAVESIDRDPGTRPARAWAGLWGRASTAGRGRAPTDHARAIARAITTLQHSLEHWPDLDPEERAVIERSWAEYVLPRLPATWRRE